MTDLEEVFCVFCGYNLEMMWEYTHHMKRWNIPYKARMVFLHGYGLGIRVMVEQELPTSSASSSENRVAAHIRNLPYWVSLCEQQGWMSSQ